MSAILNALSLLRDKYPQEKVGISASYEPSKPYIVYVASVGAGQSENPVFGWGDTPALAAEAVILKAGERDPQTLLQRRIDALKAELAKLEATPQPTAAPELSEVAAA